MGTPRLVALALLSWLALSLPTIRAQAEPDGYRAAIDEAIAEFAAHRFEEAHTWFARAHAIFPNARTLRGLGLAEFELRDYVSCMRHLELALQSGVRPLEDSLRTQTEELRSRAAGFVARLTVKSKPNASRLVIDGTAIELSTQPLLLSYGTHSLELFAAGYAPERRSVLMTGGEERTLLVEFRHPHVTNNSDIARRDRWYENPWLWVAAGAVLVAGAATGIAIAVSEPRERDPALGGSSGVVIPGL